MKSNSTLCALLLAACVIVVATLAPAQQPGIVTSEFIFETAPHPQCHASTLNAPASRLKKSCRGLKSNFLFTRMYTCLHFLASLFGLLSVPLVLTYSQSAFSADLTETIWEQTGWGGGGFFYSAAHHPTRDGVIYMGGDVNGVYKTEDSGRHWRIINNGIASYAVYAMAVSASEPEVVYAATEAGLSKSVDGGEHWRTLPRTGKKELRITGERKMAIRCIAVDPREGRVVYAASPSGKIYKSTDGGETWAVSYEKVAAKESDGTLRIQYGKVTGDYFGDFALPVVAPKEVGTIQGIGFTMKGEGVVPKDCFLILKTSAGVTFRSRNLNETFKETELRDVVLRAAEFTPDTDYLKKHPEAAGAIFSDKDWAQVTRLDFSCSGALPMEAYVAKFSRFFFSMKDGKTELIRDFKTDATMQFFGSIHVGTLARPATILRAREFRKRSESKILSIIFKSKFHPNAL